MPRIIAELPYFDEPTTVQVRGHSYPIKREQIILWISVSEQGQRQLDLRTPRFPALLDTGCNHNFIINQQHLSDWAGIHPAYLPKLASVRIGGQIVPQLAANVWMHTNDSGQRDELTSRSPFQLELTPGIAVYPTKDDESLFPRLPVLGLRAFERTGLQINIDCGRRRINIRTRPRFWILG